MEIIYLIIVGMFVGIMSSFFGVGGGSLMMPVLFMLFPHIPAQGLIPSSLGVIFLNSMINNYHFYQEKLSPSKKTIVNLILSCGTGAALGTYALHFVDSLIVKKFFGIFMIIIAIRVFLTKSQSQSQKFTEPKFKIAITGFIGSFISSITGLGGGIVFVPMLVSLIKIPAVYISPFSNVAMSIATLIGIIPHFFYELKIEKTEIYTKAYLGHVNILFVFILFFGAMLTSKIGTRLNAKVDLRIKQILLSSLFIIFAIKTLV